MSNQPQEIRYRYKLNSNWKGPKEVKVEGVILKDVWTTFNTRQYSLEKRVRTPLNLAEIVDMEEFDTKSGHIYFSSDPQTSIKKHPTYRKEDLDILTHDELSEIARSFNIDPVRKISSFLVTLILRAQIKYKEAEKIKK
jgi:hypothetical protein